VGVGFILAGWLEASLGWGLVKMFTSVYGQHRPNLRDHGIDVA